MSHAIELMRLNKSFKKKGGGKRKDVKRENDFTARSCAKGCYKQINYAFSTYRHCVYAKPPNADWPDSDRANGHVRCATWRSSDKKRSRSERDRHTQRLSQSDLPAVQMINLVHRVMFALTSIWLAPSPPLISFALFWTISFDSSPEAMPSARIRICFLLSFMRKRSDIVKDYKLGIDFTSGCDYVILAANLQTLYIFKLLFE